MNGVVLNFDASNVQVEQERTFEAIPAGWYNVTVTNTERKPSSQKPQNSYLEVTYTIMDGQYAGRKLFNRINLWNDDPTAMEIAYKGANGIASLQQAVGVFQCQTTTQLHGIPMKLKIKVRPAGPGKDGKQYDASNEVVKHAAINADVGDDGGAAAVPGAIGGGTPPWANQGAAPAPAPAGMPPAPAQAPPTQFQPPAAAQPWEQPGAAAPAPVAAAAPAPAAAGAPPWIAGAVAAAPPPAAAPAPGPTAPPPEAVPAGPVMLPAAEGVSYEEYRKAGWTDEQLIAHGKMVGPTAAPPPSAMPAAAAAPQAPAGARPPWAT